MPRFRFHRDHFDRRVLRSIGNSAVVGSDGVAGGWSESEAARGFDEGQNPPGGRGGGRPGGAGDLRGEWKCLGPIGRHDPPLNEADSRGS